MIKHQKIALVLSMPMAQNNGSGRNICEANGTSLKNGKETLNAVLRGDIGGLGNQYRNTVTKIGKYRNTVSKIDEIPIPPLWSVTLTIHLACFLSQACTHQKSTSAFEREREISNWSVQRYKSQVIGCPTNFTIEQPSEIVYSFTVKSKVFQIFTYIRQERPNERYRNTVKDLLLLNTVSQKDENRIPQGWMIPQYRTLKSKLRNIAWKKLNTAVPQIPMSLSTYKYTIQTVKPH